MSGAQMQGGASVRQCSPVPCIAWVWHVLSGVQRSRVHMLTEGEVTKGHCQVGCNCCVLYSRAEGCATGVHSNGNEGRGN